MERDDMFAIDALSECLDLWESGAWDDSNAVYNLAEVMGHLRRLTSGEARGLTWPVEPW